MLGEMHPNQDWGKPSEMIDQQYNVFMQSNLSDIWRMGIHVKIKEDILNVQ